MNYKNKLNIKRTDFIYGYCHISSHYEEGSQGLTGDVKAYINEIITTPVKPPSEK